MTNPVQDHEGNTYERAAIEECIRKFGISPITRSPLRLDQLLPNRALRDAIEEYNKILVAPGVFTSTAIPEKPSMWEPLDVVIVIDVSGSMDSKVTTQDGEDTMLSRLDICKNGAITIVETLSNQDRLSVVKFSDTGNTVLPLTPMTVAGRANAKTIINSLSAEGGTNIWDGLLHAMNTIKGSTRNAHIMLLTDGEPSSNPPRGYTAAMKAWKASNDSNYSAIISTFGFTYGLNSEILEEIAIEGGGMYSFIPDAGFVGTTFIHAISNALTTTLVAIDPASSDEVFRLEFIETVRSLYKNRREPAQAIAIIDALATKINDFLAVTPESVVQKRIVGIYQDLTGQVREAVSRTDYFQKWGRHYLPSLARAHELRQCNNFKDPGVQFYGSPQFEEIRLHAEAVFSQLPPPQPSKTYGNPAVPAVPMTTQQYQASFNNRNSGCVHENSKVHMAGGYMKYAKNVVKGDVLYGGGIVACVVETKIVAGVISMCKLGKLRISAYHPVKINGQWKFPCDLCEPKEIPCEAWYSFLVTNGSSFATDMIVDDIIVITLGHGIHNDIQNDPIAYHPFFGTEKVINALEACDGFAEGLVTIKGFTRDPMTNLVNGVLV
jgi:hypothetical protein